MKRPFLYYLIAVCCSIGLTVVSAFAGQTEPRTATYRIPFPFGKRVIEFPLGNLKVNEENRERPWYYFSDRETGLNISFSLDRRGVCNSSESCRDYIADVKTPKKENYETWRKSQLDEVYLFEWMYGEIRGEDREAWLKSQLGEAQFVGSQEFGRKMGLDVYQVMARLRQHHMHANYFIDGVWVDVHMSKVLYGEKDRKIFTDFLKSIEFKEDYPARSRREPPLILEPDRYSYTFGVPEGWDYSTEEGRKSGMRLLFFPAKSGLHQSSTVVYVTEARGKKVADVIDGVVSNAKANAPGLIVEVAPSITITSDVAAQLRILTGYKNLPQAKEALAFIDHGETVILVVLTTKNAANWQNDFKAFEEIVTGHRYSNHSSPNLALLCR